MNIGLLPLLGEPLVFLTVLVVLALSLAAHEMAHAFSADKLGDSTPRRNGRITLNPLVHLSPLGIILLVLVGFGFASTPINPNNLSRWGRVAVAAAGPLMNLLIALIAMIIFLLIPNSSSAFWPNVLERVITINILLGVLNLLPIPLLDGSRIVGGFIPTLGRSLDEFERQPYSFLIVMAAIYLLGGQIYGLSLGLRNWLFQVLGG